MQLIIKGWVLAVTAFLCLTCLILATFVFGPKLETKLLPVVTGDAVLIERTNESIRLAVLGKKHRECELTGIYAEVLFNNTWIRGDVKFLNLDTGKYINLRTSRPKGSTLWDAYEVKPAGDEIKLVVLEKCHPFWVSVTNFTELNVHLALQSQDLQKMLELQ